MQTSPASVANVTNSAVGERIGLGHSGVSRIRTGARVPSLDVMQQIAAQFRWPLMAQVNSKLAATYAEDFEAILVGEYGLVPDEPSATV